MTIELARRLLHGGAPTASIEAALAAHALQGAAFVSALLEQSPELSGLVERELARVPEGTPELHLVRPSRELGSRLPAGLCERLLVVPLRRDAEAGSVDVAAVDVLDPHLVQELGYHLAAPIRVWRAELASMRAALGELREGMPDGPGELEPMTTTPADSALPSRVPTLRPARSSASNAPIPLTRRPVPHQVFNLTRSRVPASDSSFQFSRALPDAIAAFANCDSADTVVEAMLHALEPADVLVLAVHRDMFELRAAGGSLGAQQTPLGIPAGRGTLLDQALKSKFYLGPVTPSVGHAELRARLGETVQEVYALPIHVVGRPVLMLLIARYGPSLEATRRADSVGEAAERALERIVRLKRHKAERP